MRLVWNITNLFILKERGDKYAIMEMVNFYFIFSISYRTITFLYCGLKISSKYSREEERSNYYSYTRNDSKTSKKRT